MELSAKEAAAGIRSGQIRGPVRVHDRLDLSDLERETLPDGLACYELDARGSRIKRLPANLKVEGRLILDGCSMLAELPPGLSAGSISLRNCHSIRALPENLSTWFLDMTGCREFASWPKNGSIKNGALILRDCTAMRSLPGWIGRLSHLDVAGCVLLTEIPQGVAVTSWVDVGGTNITALPPSLQGVTLRWRGVRVDERIAFHPEQLTAQDALSEQNTERRRVIIERMGHLRFARETHAEVVDEDQDPGGNRQLFFINLQDDEPLVGLVCRCPSTGRQYFLRVPPTMKSCRQAAAWVAGFDDPSLYRPLIET